MSPTDFPIGSRVVLTCDNVFRDDVFTVIGHTETNVRAVTIVFGREVELELSPDILRDEAGISK
jgi:hypothetical protein